MPSRKPIKIDSLAEKKQKNLKEYLFIDIKHSYNLRSSNKLNKSPENDENNSTPSKKASFFSPKINEKKKLYLSPLKRGEMLKLFDLDTKYGPSRGMTREERFERAQKLKLPLSQEIIWIFEDKLKENEMKCTFDRVLVNLP